MSFINFHKNSETLPHTNPNQMASKSSLCRLSFQQKTFVFCLLLVSLPLLLYTPPLKSQRVLLQVQEQNTGLAWFDAIARDIYTKKIKVGLVNIDEAEHDTLSEQLYKSYPQVLPTVSVKFDRVDKNLKWQDFFPEWIDEDHKWGDPKCPNMPMPTLENYQDVNVVVARVPCGNSNRTEKRGVRDLFRLQVNLVVANLAVEGGWMKLEGDNRRQVYVVLIGNCGPMIEIFRCDDLLMHQGEYWVYKPELTRLKQKILMPPGSCQIAPAYAQTGKEVWRAYLSELKVLKHDPRPKLAYVTMLHTSEAYVCGAIALAQSILQTPVSVIQFYNYTRDLILLADNSISPMSIKGLEAAGWKIKRIQRIPNPFAKKGSYNEWNYSKLRIWQLTDYDKIIFIDSDFLVLKNMDDFFVYPQLSAAPNDCTFFNSGLMIIEPSQCMFEELMRRVWRLDSYNKGDQGFLNEVFTWWHRLPWRLNRLKDSREIEEDELYGMHYLGVKPWMCYKDYDCNWDVEDRRVFASDSAHQLWWDVYEEMPRGLQSYCGLSQRMEERILRWRREARNANFSDMHWNIEIRDPRTRLGKLQVV
ncbi:putative UDP-glucuronate:xylan alpha-glucuronosyltransferase 4 [Prosopis cineraria]|uniref:putative UDP-glucuronate:xylan alpha-glucuronosyltransferase 4 n=1 Tax=Prosopis cineraria TaxID=364024 RepID=UPI00241094DD|nr:putative UDP-glucuronate:xylan alpha-glucuronosyltransferase 4 [Prosopis cineraria]